MYQIRDQHVSQTVHYRRGHWNIDHSTNGRLIYDVNITQLLTGNKCKLEINRSIYRLRTVYIVNEETSKSN